MKSHESPLFSFGKAPFAIFAVAVLSGLYFANQSQKNGAIAAPDLLFTVFSREHKADYQKVLPEFERIHNVRVKLIQLDAQSLQSRLQAAITSGAPAPDIVEIPAPGIGTFTRGPLEDIGLVDLTERVRQEKLETRMVPQRFHMWSSRGHVFALPHEVHPVALGYRRDLLEAAGVDPASLATWDEFMKVGRRLTVDLDGDGVPDRYMIDLDENGDYLRIMLNQTGTGFFDGDGKLVFDNADTRRALSWFIRASRGKEKISVPLGHGQNLSKGIMDGRCLFTFVPDWRSRAFLKDVPSVSGKMALMPLPAWTNGGRRTSTFGGTGLAITKKSPNVELAWELAKFLYLNPEASAERFEATFIVPPLPESWTLPALAKPVPYWSAVPLGTFYAKLAADVPDIYVTSYEDLVRKRFMAIAIKAGARYEKGETDLDRVIEEELARGIANITRITSRNRFLAAEGTSR